MTTPRTLAKTAAPTSLVDRAGLDRPRLAKIISRGLEGADDGELFLEYRQSEALVFDNGRLSRRPTTPRRVSGCAPSRTKRSAMPMLPMFRRPRSSVPPMPFARSRAAIPAICRAARPHQRQALWRRQPARHARLSRPRRSFWKPSTLMPAPRTRACARFRQALARDLAGGRDPARRRRDLSRYPPAGARQCLGRGRRRRSPGDRQRRLWRPRRL